MTLQLQEMQIDQTLSPVDIEDPDKCYQKYKMSRKDDLADGMPKGPEFKKSTTSVARERNKQRNIFSHRSRLEASAETTTLL